MFTLNKASSGWMDLVPGCSGCSFANTSQTLSHANLPGWERNSYWFHFPARVLWPGLAAEPLAVPFTCFSLSSPSNFPLYDPYEVWGFIFPLPSFLPTGLLWSFFPSSFFLLSDPKCNRLCFFIWLGRVTREQALPLLLREQGTEFMSELGIVASLVLLCACTKGLCGDSSGSFIVCFLGSSSLNKF